MAFGAVLIVVGLILLLESLGVTEAGIREWWPLMLIGSGLVILYERVRRRLRRR